MTVTITDSDLKRDDISSLGQDLGNGFRARLEHGKAIVDSQEFITGHQCWMRIMHGKNDTPIAQLWGSHLVVLDNDLSWRGTVRLLNQLRVKRDGTLVEFFTKVTTYPNLRELFYRWRGHTIRVGEYSPTISY